MKIVECKDYIKSKPRWWDGRKMSCSVCGTVVELDAEDVPEVVEYTIHSTHTMTFGAFSCPVCYAKQGITFFERLAYVKNFVLDTIKGESE